MTIYGVVDAVFVGKVQNPKFAFHGPCRSATFETLQIIRRESVVENVLPTLNSEINKPRPKN